MGEKVEAIARVCHQANKGLCEARGDNSQRDWDEAEPWQRESAIKGVRFALANPHATASEQHSAWMKDKIEAGWIYGPVKNVEKMTHPCIVPYYDLPFEEKAKDYVFRAIVHAMKETP